MNGDQSMLTPYASPVSLYCAKLRILLRHKQAQWREVSPEGGYNSPRISSTGADRHDAGDRRR
jgi:hypothetical protein